MNLDDITLEQRLRDTYAAVDAAIDLPAPSVDVLPLDGETDPMRRAPESPRRRARALTAAFAALLVVVVAVAVAVVAENRSSSDRHRRPGRVQAPAVPQVFPTYPDHQGPELLLAPTSVPGGFHVIVSTLQGGTGGSGSPRGTVQFWVKLDAAAQRPLASFQVAWGPADLGEAARQSGMPGLESEHGDALDAFRSQSVPATVSGHDGLYSESLATFAWEQNNQLVTVSGATDSPIAGPWPEHLTRDELENIAAHLVRDPDGRYTLTEIPAGFQLSAEEPSFALRGTNARELAYSDGANHGFDIQLVDDTQQPPGLKLVNPPARLITIRGRRAVSTPFLNGGPGCGAVDYFLCADVPHLSVIWTEPDNTTVTVTSVGITETQLLAIAQSLEPVQPNDWPKVGTPTP